MIDVTELGKIPDGWTSLPLGDVCKLINGRGFKPYEWVREGFPIIRIQNLNGSDDFNYFDGHYDPKIEIENGQLLFAWSGSRGTSFGPHIWKGKKALLNYHTWKVVITTKNLAPDYFYFALKALTKKIEESAHGASALVHTQMGEMKKFILPIPNSTKEQTAIANALSDVDGLIAELEKLIAKKQAIKTATMQQLLTGRTRLPEFANHPDGTPKGYKQTEMGEIPEDWEINNVGTMTKEHKQGFYTKDSYKQNGTRLIRITDLHNPHVDFESMPRLAVSASDFNQYKVEVGDILLARSGAIGRYGIVQDNKKAVFASYLIRFRLNNEWINNEFFGFSYQSEEIQNQLLSITQGSSNININANNIKALNIRLPPMPEQTAIANILSDMDEEIQSLRLRLDKTRHIKQGMMQELLTGKTRLV